jgi:hypothetical protein
LAEEPAARADLVVLGTDDRDESGGSPFTLSIEMPSARAIRAAFALGLDCLRVENGALLANLELDARGPSPDEYPRVLDALENLASWIEAAAKGCL